MSILEKVKWVDLPSSKDARGVLTSIESEKDTPFEIKRVFYMHHIVADRGGHAHRDTDQIVVSVSGKFKLDVSDGVATRTYILENPIRGIYTPRMVFIKLYDFSPGAVCMVFASTYYDMSKSIRSWDEYLIEIKGS
jgi:dTDP-4-dehydrorhamnose 3,5-epimerase-like enzyme